jgi:hypothetical protein
MPALVPIATAVAGNLVSGAISDALAPTPSTQPSTQLSSADAANAAQTKINNEQYDFYKTNYQPLETSLISDVTGAGGPADQERAAGQAHGDTTAAYDSARQGMLQGFAAYGLNPNSGRFGDLEKSLTLNRAATDAQSQNSARIAARELGFAKKSAVAQMGRGIPSNASAGLAASSLNNLRSANTGANLIATQNTGLMPITNAVTGGVNAAFNAGKNWFNTPSQPAPLQPSFGTDTFSTGVPTITSTPGGTTESFVG